MKSVTLSTSVRVCALPLIHPNCLHRSSNIQQQIISFRLGRWGRICFSVVNSKYKWWLPRSSVTPDNKKKLLLSHQYLQYCLFPTPPRAYVSRYRKSAFDMHVCIHFLHVILKLQYFDLVPSKAATLDYNNTAWFNTQPHAQKAYTHTRIRTHPQFLFTLQKEGQGPLETDTGTNKHYKNITLCKYQFNPFSSVNGGQGGCEEWVHLVEYLKHFWHQF